jgi:hypothetical protein
LRAELSRREDDFQVDLGLFAQRDQEQRAQACTRPPPSRPSRRVRRHRGCHGWRHIGGGRPAGGMGGACSRSHMAWRPTECVLVRACCLLAAREGRPRRARARATRLRTERESRGEPRAHCGAAGRGRGAATARLLSSHPIACCRSPLVACRRFPQLLIASRRIPSHPVASRRIPSHPIFSLSGGGVASRL